MATSAPQTCTFFANEDAQVQNDFLVKPLDFYDVEAINAQVRGKLIKAARLSLVDCTSVREAELTLDAAIRQASLISLLNEGGLKYFSSVDGMTVVLHQCIKPADPQAAKPTLQDVMLIVLDNRNQAEYQYAFQFAMGMAKPRKAKPQDAVNPTSLPTQQTETVNP